MKITCKKCGASIDIDVSGGECPRCGAIYYILPGDDSDDLSLTQRWAIPENQGGTRGRKSSDDLDATQVWRPEDIAAAGNRSGPKNPPQKRKPGLAPATGDGAAPAKPPVKKTPDRPSFSEKGGYSAKSGERNREMSNRTRGFIVGAVALLAVLVVVLSLMSGMLDFDKKDETPLSMPNTVGMDKERAVSLLEGMGLNVEVSTQPSDQDEGRVIRQSAKEGKKVKPGDTVMLIVSSGPAIKEEEQDTPVIVPSLVGSTFEKAKLDLEALGLRLIKFSDEYSDAYPEGTIISQDPVAGEQLRPGEYVKVILSKGPEPDPEYIISVTVGKGGSVSPRGRVSIKEGSSVTFTITPDEGYEIREVKVDGQNVGVVESYTFSDVRSDHTIYAIFRVVQSTPEPSPSPTQEPAPQVTDNGAESDSGNFAGE
ncbi:MAG TPA: PASTA domain-containing protein [Clostridiales bacterium]|nr:PASTA domain-containing protein [Clostridiales bacterium]